MKRILVGLFVFTIGIAGAACTSYRRATAPPVAVIPEGWKKVNTDSFSFSMPPTMRGGDERGTDSALWEYYGNGITLVIESGSHPPPLRMDYVNEPGYRDEFLEIDGRKAKIATFQLSDSRAAYFPNEGKYVAAVHFPDIGNGFETRMTLWANCEDLAKQEVAKQIFLTLKFK